MQQTIHYSTSSDGTRIAFAITGSGPPLVAMPVLPLSHLDLELQLPYRGEWYESMAEHFSILRYDGRGAGLSDRDVDDLSLERHIEDLRVVTERAGLQRFALLGRHLAGPVAIAFAARYPERVSRLILWHAFARSSDYSDVKRTQALMSLLSQDWELFTEATSYANAAWPEVEQAHRYAAYKRAAIESDVYARAIEAFKQIDYSEYLPQIACPTLVFHRRDVTKFSSSVGRSLSAAIPDARLVMPEGSSWHFFAEDLSNITATFKAFLLEDEPLKIAYANGAAIQLEVGLTEREAQILKLLSAGRQNKMIATELSVSVHTVDRHIANIYNKLGAHNRVEATAFAMKYGIV